MRSAQEQQGWVAYADGSCIGNPGPGGWGVVLIEPSGATLDLSGANPSTTNNRMELTAAIEGLRRIPSDELVKLHSDSQYLVKTMTLGWKRRENLDLWKLLDAEAASHRVSWHWVRGHAGDPLNERADQLARSAAEGRPAQKAAAAHQTKSLVAEEIGRQLAPLLEPDETIRRCVSCGAGFVSRAATSHCTHAKCQLAARTQQVGQ